jgi:hypothetical protein
LGVDTLAARLLSLAQELTNPNSQAELPAFVF